MDLVTSLDLPFVTHEQKVLYWETSRYEIKKLMKQNSELTVDLMIKQNTINKLLETSTKETNTI